MPLTAPTSGLIIILAIYSLSLLGYCLRFILNRKKLSAFSLQLALAGGIIHLGLLSHHFYLQGYPFIISSFDTFQIVSVGIIFAYILLRFLYKSFVAAFVLLPIAMIFYISSLSGIVNYSAQSHFLNNPWAFIHLIFIFVSMALFLVSFVMGILYLFREYQIKQKKLGGILERLPPLEIIDRIHFRFLTTAFVFFTLGIITGAGWSKSTTGFYVTNGAKQFWSFGVWFAFALFINLRMRKGWVGKKGILMSTMGLVMVTLMFVWLGK